MNTQDPVSGSPPAALSLCGPEDQQVECGDFLSETLYAAVEAYYNRRRGENQGHHHVEQEGKSVHGIKHHVRMNIHTQDSKSWGPTET